MMEWKSNARWHQDVKEGTIFTLKDIKTDISIHKIHGLGNKWYLTCRAINIYQFGLNTDDFDLAVENAKVIIREKLKLLNDYFECFVSDESENEIVRY